MWERRLFYYLRRLTDDEQQAWDVLQRTWLRVIRGIEGLRDPGRFKSWLYTVARRAAADNLRELRAENSRRAEEAELDNLQDDSPGPEEFENAALVHYGLGRLPLAEREILTLFFLEDFSLAEIAEITDRPPGTVKCRLHRAKKALRKVLEREGGGR